VTPRRRGAERSRSWTGSSARGADRDGRAGERGRAGALGSETLELAYALAKIVRQGAGSDRVVLPEQTSDALDPFRVPIAALAEAEEIVVFEDCPVLDRAPLLELWLKQARRKGAQVTRIGPSGDIQRAHARLLPAASWREGNALGKRLRAAERVILLWSAEARPEHALARSRLPRTEREERVGRPAPSGQSECARSRRSWAAAGDEIDNRSRSGC